jgi:hypothetical protein
MDASQIKPHLMVHAKGEGSMNGAPGVHIGTVDQIEEGEYIKLTKDDSPNGEHRWLPIAWVESVDDKAVYLNKTEAEAKAGILTQSPADHIAAVQAERNPVTGEGVG